MATVSDTRPALSWRAAHGRRRGCRTRRSAARGGRSRRAGAPRGARWRAGPRAEVVEQRELAGLGRRLEARRVGTRTRRRSARRRPSGAGRRSSKSPTSCGALAAPRRRAGARRRRATGRPSVDQLGDAARSSNVAAVLLAELELELQAALGRHARRRRPAPARRSVNPSPHSIAVEADVGAEVEVLRQPPLGDGDLERAAAGAPSARRARAAAATLRRVGRLVRDQPARHRDLEARTSGARSARDGTPASPGRSPGSNGLVAGARLRTPSCSRYRLNRGDDTVLYRPCVRRHALWAVHGRRSCR